MSCVPKPTAREAAGLAERIGRRVTWDEVAELVVKAMIPDWMREEIERNAVEWYAQ